MGSPTLAEFRAAETERSVRSACSDRGLLGPDLGPAAQLWPEGPATLSGAPAQESRRGAPGKGDSE
eukprot:7466630-Alexandrium_andersonii.AAC.1